VASGNVALDCAEGAAETDGPPGLDKQVARHALEQLQSWAEVRDCAAVRPSEGRCR